MKNQNLIEIDTPYGDIPISLRERCFHGGTPSTAIVIDWYFDMVDYGLENDWQFTIGCLQLWLNEEYPYNHREIIDIISLFIGEDGKHAR